MRFALHTLSRACEKAAYGRMLGCRQTAWNSLLSSLLLALGLLFCKLGGREG